MIVRLRRSAVASPGSNDGRITARVYVSPCPGVFTPIGTTSSFDALSVTTTGTDLSFYWNQDDTVLPSYPANTRLVFELYTDSDRWAFEIAGTGAAAPTGYQWWVRGPGGAWSTPPGAGIPRSAMWLRGCGATAVTPG
jgi:hypothetical protein